MSMKVHLSLLDEYLLIIKLPNLFDHLVPGPFCVQGKKLWRLESSAGLLPNTIDNNAYPW